MNKIAAVVFTAAAFATIAPPSRAQQVAQTNATLAQAPAPAPQKHTHSNKPAPAPTPTPAAAAPAPEKKRSWWYWLFHRRPKAPPVVTVAPTPTPAPAKSRTMTKPAPAEETAATAPKQRPTPPPQAEQTKPAPALVERKKPRPTPPQEESNSMNEPAPFVPPPTSTEKQSTQQIGDGNPARYQEVKQKALQDKHVQELQEKADNASDGDEQRKASEKYYKALFNKMRNLDPSLKDRIDRTEAATLRRVGAE